MKICVIGGGNIGTAVAADLAGKNQVTVLTGHPEKWRKRLSSYDTEKQITVHTVLEKVTGNAEEALVNAEVVFLTVPSFLTETAIQRCLPYLDAGMIFCIMPGTGGVEFFCREMLEKGVILAGFDRVTRISRVSVYGSSVNVAKKKGVRMAAVPCRETKRIARLMSGLFEMDCEPLDNYLTVTLTPSNPILHTSRLYDLFGNYRRGMTWDRNLYFYAEWTDSASELLLGCDEELQSVCRAFETAAHMNLQGVKPLKQHYEVRTASEMTHKMQSIHSLKNILSPMVRQNGFYVPDFNSRYFLEDFPYGLCILRGFAELAGVPAGHMDKILQWYCGVSGKAYYDDDRFVGKDLAEAAIPQNYGITSFEALEEFYG